MKTPNYNQSILSVSKSILKHYHVYHASDTLKKLDQILKNESDHIIYMLLDGLGNNIIDLHLDASDFLYKHRTKKISSVFPPTTVAATHAVLSAKSPFESGYLGWTQYFDEVDKNIVIFKNEDYDSQEIYDISFKDKYLNFNAITEMIQLEHKDVKVSSLFPSFVKDGSKTFDEHIEKLDDIIHQNEKSFTYVYWAEPDYSMHELGIKDKKIKFIIQDLNNKIETFYSKSQKKITLIIIADHGMVDVAWLNLFDDHRLMSFLKRTPSIEPRATNFFIHDGMQNAFKMYFKKTYGKYFYLLSKEEMLKKNILGYGKKHEHLDMFLGDFMSIAHTKYSFNFKEPSDFKAHHAGLTKEELSVPLIVCQNH